MTLPNNPITVDNILDGISHFRKGMDMQHKMFEDNQVYRDKTIARTLSIGRATIWLWVSQGHLAAPTKYGPRVSGWPGYVLNEWLEGKNQQKKGGLS
ncbi:helix-turn-helix transcriptional regulator [Pelovirga terrestris]|uniref:AlpA family phage regulatory protein n=1 Tax=Pelovirga terrestris TaxID=2771352 RepID=A0A8J6UGB5_9BACT|nr:hypothetical protein [Pelovirga terrestris]MBD1399433.1 hypothetical protein [Pelovirga terrestris]